MFVVETEGVAERRLALLAEALLGSFAGAKPKWATLKASKRSVVLRGAGVVVKQTRGHTSASFQRELAALRFAESNFPGIAPRLLAADEPNRVLLLEDLGDGPSLADALLGSDELFARAAVMGYVEGLAALHERTRSLRSPRMSPAWLEELFAKTTSSLQDQRDSAVPAMVAPAQADFSRLGTLLCQPTNSSVFSFGDMCPDNNVLTPTGIRFLDLEVAGYTSPAVDLSNITMPFPTCWCSFDLPAELRDVARNRYASLTSDHAGLEDRWVADAFFAVASAVLTAPTVDADDEPWVSDDGHELPTKRVRVLHRLARTLEHQEVEHHVPALAAWLQHAHSSLHDRWNGIGPLPLAPAFRVSV